MKPLLPLIPAIAILGACGTTTAQAPLKKGNASMSTSIYTPPLAEGYQPGVPTQMEKNSPKSAFSADEIIRRALRVATETHSAEDLTVERIEQTIGIKMPYSSPDYPENRYASFWISKNWLFSFQYIAPQPVLRQEKSFRVIAVYDSQHWSSMPDRSELCVNRQMDVAAAEKVLLEHGFRMTREPNDRFRDRWWYHRGDEAAVELFSFGDGGIPSRKDICIRQIIVMGGKK